MKNIDCLIIGHSEGDLKRSIKLRELAFGKNSAAYQDMDQGFITINDTPYSPLDYLNEINYDTFKGTLSNTDFIWPPILVIGSFLKQYNLSFDYVNDGDDKELLERKLTSSNYLTIAITTTLYVESEPIIRLVKFIRKFNSNVKIVVGGPFIYSNAKDEPIFRINTLFKQLGADVYVVSGEGQKTLVYIINKLKENGDLSEVKNIIYKNNDSNSKNNEFIHNDLETEYNEMKEHRVDYNIFKDDINGFMSVGTAKSCPYACSYCTFPQRAGRYSYLCVEDVENELNKLRDLGIHTITFIDDTFNVPKTRFKDILRMMIKNKYSFKWNSFFRADQSDDETIELMAEAGCEGVFLGMESGSDYLLKNMNKTSRRVHYEKAIPKLIEHNILAHVNYIIGFPGETEETVMDTINFIKEFKPPLYKAQIWYCEKASPVWNEKDKYDIKGEGFEWSHSTMNSTEAMHLLDKLVNEIDESVYNREEGLGQWSFFYLQRKGFKLNQIKGFVTNFYKIANYQRLNDCKDVPNDLFNKMNTYGKINVLQKVSV
jgi:anaerobic magnesium-protoporphyrin IX monomethyl ester cyclase